MKLNHPKIRRLMKANKMRPIDLAGRLGVSRQAANYIIQNGGVSYADRLAKLFKVDRLSLIK